MKVCNLKYLFVIALPLVVAVSFLSTGYWALLPIVVSFFVIPILELIIGPNSENISAAEHDARKNNPLFDWMLYFMVPLQYGFLIWFLLVMNQPDLSTVTLIGRVSGMGILCGVIGINVAHELGHRPNKAEQILAKMLLLTSQYMHFYIEHNRGHHKKVSTPEDPSSARKNEPLQWFWLRSITTGYISAWRLENERLKRKKKNPFSLKNEMLRFLLIQLALILVIYVAFNGFVLACYLASAAVGFLLLETVNYIEHYGLQRKKKTEFRYEDTAPKHSWNSDHVIGRLMLFELSRHSDHHYQPAKKYQLLDHFDESPQMPTGYPGMVVLALIPPLWFWVMNKRVDASLAEN